MRIKIIQDNLKISNRDQKLIQEKLNSDIDKHIGWFNPEIKTATVRVTKQARWGYVVNFNMWLPEKFQLFIEERGKNLSLAVNAVKDKLSRRIKKYKERIEKRE
jgi:ribosome-associated translation inhibitor RaiA